MPECMNTQKSREKLKENASAVVFIDCDLLGLSNHILLNIVQYI